MNRLKLVILFPAFMFVLLPGNAGILKEEVYYTPGISKPAAKRFYEYSVDGNIVRIVETNSQNPDTIELKYTYDLDVLQTVEEFINKKRIKYAVFSYVKGILEKRIEYNNDGDPVLLKEFVYKDQFIAEIKEYLPGNVYLGRRTFTYLQGLVQDEKLEDADGRVMVTRSYVQKDGLITSVEYYMKDRHIRTVEKRYENSDTISGAFGYPVNFGDIR